MQQQINLLNAFAPPLKPILPASMLFKLLAVLIVILAGIQINGLLEKNKLDKKHDALLAVQELRGSELAQLSNQLPESVFSEEDKSEVDKLTKDIVSKTGLLEIISQPNRKFSDYMQALATKVTPGIWLKDIIIDQADDNIALLGRTLNSNLVPLFLADLVTTQAFSDVEFKQLKLAKPALAGKHMAFALRTKPNFEDIYIFPQDADDSRAAAGSSAGGKSGTAANDIIGSLLKQITGGKGGLPGLPALGDILNSKKEGE